MSHIFGLEHSLGGILGQVGSVFGDTGANVFNNPAGWGGIINAFGMGGTEFPTPSGGDTPGFGETPINGDNYMAINGNACAPGSTEIREVVIDKATGQVICIRPKKTRHRRKRLATQSDITDLAALKNILGNGKAFDSWIATRGRR